MDLVNLQIAAILPLCRDRHFAGARFFVLPYRKTYSSCEKHESQSLHYLLFTACHLVSASFVTSLRQIYARL
jgi:hypothetical protein